MGSHFLGYTSQEGLLCQICWPNRLKLFLKYQSLSLLIIYLRVSERTIVVDFFLIFEKLKCRILKNNRHQLTLIIRLDKLAGVFLRKLGHQILAFLDEEKVFFLGKGKSAAFWSDRKKIFTRISCGWGCQTSLRASFLCCKAEEIFRDSQLPQWFNIQKVRKLSTWETITNLIPQLNRSQKLPLTAFPSHFY